MPDFNYPIPFSMLLEAWIPDMAINSAANFFGIPVLTLVCTDPKPGEPTMPYELNQQIKGLKIGTKFTWRGVEWVALDDDSNDQFCCIPALFVDISR